MKRNLNGNEDIEGGGLVASTGKVKPEGTIDTIRNVCLRCRVLHPVKLTVVSCMTVGCLVLFFLSNNPNPVASPNQRVSPRESYNYVPRPDPRISPRGSFDYKAPDPGASVSDVDEFSLPYATSPLSRDSVNACYAEWGQVTERKAGNKQLPKSSLREDVTLYNEFFKKGALLGKSGFYLELGGFDGVAESNSRFYERCLGWSGLLIEASPKMFPKLAKNRPLAHKLHVSPTCPDESGVITFLPSSFTNAMIYDPDNKDHKKFASNTVDVRCGPLKKYIAELGVKHIDLFSLDVEGAELMVLQNFDFSAVSVDVVMVESDNAYHKSNDEGNMEIRRLMREAGFVLKKSLVQKSDVYVREGFVY